MESQQIIWTWNDWFYQILVQINLSNGKEYKWKVWGMIMGVKDITEKALEEYNDVFSDIVNVLLFNGEEIIGSDELVEASPYSNYTEDGKVRDQERDIYKYKCIGF